METKGSNSNFYLFFLFLFFLKSHNCLAKKGTVISEFLTLLSTSLQLICDWTMYISESTSPVHSLSFRLASLRSELTFLK